MRPHLPVRLQSHHRSNQATTLVALGLATALAVAGCRVAPGDPASAARSDPTPTTTSPSAGSSPSPTVGAPAKGWRMLPGAPVPASGFSLFFPYATVWTGTELIVHAPQFEASHVEVAYNPTRNTWRTLAANPYPYASIESEEYAVWDGAEMLTFGNVNTAYNPTTNTWRQLRGGPVARGSVVVWTGRQVLAWGGGGGQSFRSDGGAYDPATDSWQKIPSAPLAAREGAGVWTGRELVVVGGQSPTAAFADAAAYNPATRSWRKLPSLPAPRFAATLTWTGTEVLVAGGRRHGWSTTVVDARTSSPYADAMAYNPTTNRWRHLPDMPIARFGHTAVWTGHRLLIWGGVTVAGGDWAAATPEGLVYDPARNRWSAMATSPLSVRTGAVAAWTGTEMIIWGGADPRLADDPAHAGPVDGAAFRPTG